MNSFVILSERKFVKMLLSSFFMIFCLLSVVINGTHPTLRADPYSPGAVLRVLHAQGWVIPPEEHDAHELLHVVLTSLEEEAIRPKKVRLIVKLHYHC